MKVLELGVRAALDAPLLEISGLGQRPRSLEGRMQVLAVGDQDFTVVSATVGGDETSSNLFVLDPLVD